jgi:hypothetical protein
MIEAVVDWFRVENGKLLIAGWAMNTSMLGQHPWSCLVRIGQAQQPLHTDLRQSGLHRPDVAGAFGPQFNPYVGYQLTLGLDGAPAGEQVVTVEWADSQASKYNQFSVTI